MCTTVDVREPRQRGYFTKLGLWPCSVCRFFVAPATPRAGAAPRVRQLRPSSRAVGGTAAVAAGFATRWLSRCLFRRPPGSISLAGARRSHSAATGSAPSTAKTFQTRGRVRQSWRSSPAEYPQSTRYPPSPARGLTSPPSPWAATGVQSSRFSASRACSPPASGTRATRAAGAMGCGEDGLDGRGASSHASQAAGYPSLAEAGRSIGQPGA